MHGQTQQHLDELTLHFYNHLNPLFNTDTQTVDHLHFARCFGTTVCWYGGGPIYFIYAQNDRLGQLFMAALDANNHHNIDYMGSTSNISKYTNNEKEIQTL
eukprot:15317385-Ditylum_brightwellii.AAC.1